MTTSVRNDPTSNASNDTDDESRSPTRCDITLCGSPASGNVEHPQRGEMVVCDHHRREIDALPEWRFIGAEVAR